MGAKRCSAQNKTSHEHFPLVIYYVVLFIFLVWDLILVDKPTSPQANMPILAKQKQSTALFDAAWPNTILLCLRDLECLNLYEAAVVCENIFPPIGKFA